MIISRLLSPTLRRRVLLMLGGALLLALASLLLGPHAALAQSYVGNVPDNNINPDAIPGGGSALVTQINSWQPILTTLAMRVFASLIVIDIAWTVIQFLLGGRENLGELIGQMVLKALTFSVIYYLVLLHGYEYSQIIVGSFLSAGSQLGINENYSFDGLIAEGVGYAAPMIIQTIAFAFIPNILFTVGFTALQQPLIYTELFGVTAVVGAYVFMAGALALAWIEMYMVTCVGILMLGFSGSRWTQQFGYEKYLQYSLSIGIKLLMTYIIIGIARGIGSSLIPTELVPGIGAIQAGFMGGIMTMLVYNIPAFASGLIQGSSSASAGAGLQAAQAAQGAMMQIASMAQQAMQQQSESMRELLNQRTNETHTSGNVATAGAQASAGLTRADDPNAAAGTVLSNAEPAPAPDSGNFLSAQALSGPMPAMGEISAGMQSALGFDGTAGRDGFGRDGSDGLMTMALISGTPPGGRDTALSNRDAEEDPYQAALYETPTSPNSPQDGSIAAASAATPVADASMVSDAALREEMQDLVMAYPEGFAEQGSFDFLAGRMSTDEIANLAELSGNPLTPDEMVRLDALGDQRTLSMEMYGDPDMLTSPAGMMDENLAYIDPTSPDAITTPYATNPDGTIYQGDMTYDPQSGTYVPADSVDPLFTTAGYDPASGTFVTPGAQIAASAATTGNPDTSISGTTPTAINGTAQPVAGVDPIFARTGYDQTSGAFAPAAASGSMGTDTPIAGTTSTPLGAPVQAPVEGAAPAAPVASGASGPELLNVATSPITAMDAGVVVQPPVGISAQGTAPATPDAKPAEAAPFATAAPSAEPVNASTSGTTMDAGVVTPAPAGISAQGPAATPPSEAKLTDAAILAGAVATPELFNVATSPITAMDAGVVAQTPVGISAQSTTPATADAKPVEAAPFATAAPSAEPVNASTSGTTMDAGVATPAPAGISAQGPTTTPSSEAKLTDAAILAGAVATPELVNVATSPITAMDAGVVAQTPVGMSAQGATPASPDAKPTEAAPFATAAPLAEPANSSASGTTMDAGVVTSAPAGIIAQGPTTTPSSEAKLTDAAILAGAVATPELLNVATSPITAMDAGVATPTPVGINAQGTTPATPDAKPAEAAPFAAAAPLAEPINASTSGTTMDAGGVAPPVGLSAQGPSTTPSSEAKLTDAAILAGAVATPELLNVATSPITAMDAGLATPTPVGINAQGTTPATPDAKPAEAAPFAAAAPLAEPISASTLGTTMDAGVATSAPVGISAQGPTTTPSSEAKLADAAILAGAVATPESLNVATSPVAPGLATPTPVGISAQSTTPASPDAKPAEAAPFAAAAPLAEPISASTSGTTMDAGVATSAPAGISAQGPTTTPSSEAKLADAAILAGAVAGPELLNVATSPVAPGLATPTPVGISAQGTTPASPDAKPAEAAPTASMATGTSVPEPVIASTSPASMEAGLATPAPVGTSAQGTPAMASEAKPLDATAAANGTPTQEPAKVPAGSAQSIEPGNVTPTAVGSVQVTPATTLEPKAAEAMPAAPVPTSASVQEAATVAAGSAPSTDAGLTAQTPVGAIQGSTVASSEAKPAEAMPAAPAATNVSVQEAAKVPAGSAPPIDAGVVAQTPAGGIQGATAPSSEARPAEAMPATAAGMSASSQEPARASAASAPPTEAVGNAQTPTGGLQASTASSSESKPAEAMPAAPVATNVSGQETAKVPAGSAPSMDAGLAAQTPVGNLQGATAPSLEAKPAEASPVAPVGISGSVQEPAKASPGSAPPTDAGITAQTPVSGVQGVAAPSFEAKPAEAMIAAPIATNASVQEAAKVPSGAAPPTDAGVAAQTPASGIQGVAAPSFEAKPADAMTAAPAGGNAPRPEPANVSTSGNPTEAGNLASTPIGGGAQSPTTGPSEAKPAEAIQTAPSASVQEPAKNSAGSAPPLDVGVIPQGPVGGSTQGTTASSSPETKPAEAAPAAPVAGVASGPEPAKVAAGSPVSSIDTGAAPAPAGVDVQGTSPQQSEARPVAGAPDASPSKPSQGEVLRSPASPDASLFAAKYDAPAGQEPSIRLSPPQIEVVPSAVTLMPPGAGASPTGAPQEAVLSTPGPASNQTPNRMLVESSSNTTSERNPEDAGLVTYASAVNRPIEAAPANDRVIVQGPTVPSLTAAVVSANVSASPTDPASPILSAASSPTTDASTPTGTMSDPTSASMSTNTTAGSTNSGSSPISPASNTSGSGSNSGLGDATTGTASTGGASTGTGAPNATPQRDLGTTVTPATLNPTRSEPSPDIAPNANRIRETTASEHPATSEPAKNAPAAGQTINNSSNAGPASNAQQDGNPTASTPANGTPANGMPANGTPANGTPANGTPANATATNGTPANGTATNGTATNGTAANGTSEPVVAAPVSAVSARTTPAAGGSSAGSGADGDEPSRARRQTRDPEVPDGSGVSSPGAKAAAPGSAAAPATPAAAAPTAATTAAPSAAPTSAKPVQAAAETIAAKGPADPSAVGARFASKDAAPKDVFASKPADAFRDKASDRLDRSDKKSNEAKGGDRNSKLSTLSDKELRSRLDRHDFNKLPLEERAALLQEEQSRFSGDDG